MQYKIIHAACQHKNQISIVCSTVKWLKYYRHGIKTLTR